MTFPVFEMEEQLAVDTAVAIANMLQFRETDLDMRW